MKKYLLPLLFLFSYYGCESDHNQNVLSQAANSSTNFGDYWYRGLAEITSYTLQQSRYGEVHNGEAVLIFVTEDFSGQKQVKLDDPEKAGKDAIKVLKMNALRKFNTGVYPYTVMTSTFSPLDQERYPRSLKITTSVQEWCGHAFVQMNYLDDQYRVQQYSYFETEGDRISYINSAISEDEIWATIRLNPDDLPTGEITIIPGTLYQRFAHIPWKSVQATALLMPVLMRDDLMEYKLVYHPGLNRILSIQFKRKFPYEIESWKEIEIDDNDKELTTVGTLNKRIMLDYWTKNSRLDIKLRNELGLKD